MFDEENKKVERTPQEKLEGIAFLKSLNFNDETIEAIEDSIDHPERSFPLTDGRELLE